MQTHKIASKVMESLEAFHGSKPAIDANNILIVRGMTKKQFNVEMEVFLSNVLKNMGAREIDMFSKEGGSIIGIMDERIRSNVPIQSETDISGIQMMKDSLEAMNCDVAVTMGISNDIGLFIVTWDDKSGLGLRFVEVVVANLE